MEKSKKGRNSLASMTCNPSSELAKKHISGKFSDCNLLHRKPASPSSFQHHTTLNQTSKCRQKSTLPRASSQHLPRIILPSKDSSKYAFELIFSGNLSLNNKTKPNRLSAQGQRASRQKNSLENTLTEKIVQSVRSFEKITKLGVNTSCKVNTKPLELISLKPCPGTISDYLKHGSQIKSKGSKELVNHIKQNHTSDKTSPYNSCKPPLVASTRPRSRQIKAVSRNEKPSKLCEVIERLSLKSEKNKQVPVKSFSKKISAQPELKMRIRDRKSESINSMSIKKPIIKSVNSRSDRVTRTSSLNMVKNIDLKQNKKIQIEKCVILSTIEVESKKVDDLNNQTEVTTTDVTPSQNNNGEGSSSTSQNYCEIKKSRFHCSENMPNDLKLVNSSLKKSNSRVSSTESFGPNFRITNKDNLPFPIAKELMNAVHELCLTEHTNSSQDCEVNPPLNSPVSNPTSSKSNSVYNHPSYSKTRLSSDTDDDLDLDDENSDSDSEQCTYHDFVSDYLQLESMREVNHLDQVLCRTQICRKIKGADPNLSLEQLKLAKSHYLHLPCFEDATFFTKIKVPPEIYMSGKQPDKDLVKIQYLQTKMDDIHKKRLKNLSSSQSSSTTYKGKRESSRERPERKKIVTFSPECYVKSLEKLMESSVQLPQWAKDCYKDSSTSDEEENDEESTADEEQVEQDPSTSQTKSTGHAETAALAMRIFNMYKNGKLRKTKLIDKCFTDGINPDFDDNDNESLPESP